MKSHLFLLSVLLLWASAARSQSVPEDSAVAKKNWAFSATANIDAAFAFDLNRATSLTSPGLRHARPTLGWANAILTATRRRAELTADLIYGPRADFFYPYDGRAGRLVNQLFVKYRFTDRLALSVGNLTTTFNSELSVPFANFTYTNSLVYNVIPSGYSGAMADIGLNGNWTTKLGLLGDSGRKWEPHFRPHALLSLNRETGSASLTFDLISGNDGDSTRYSMADCYATFHISEKLDLGALVHAASDNRFDGINSTWAGATVFGRCGLRRWLDLGARAEFFGDPDGFAFGEKADRVVGGAVCLKFKFWKFAVAPEVRVFKARRPIFPERKSGVADHETVFLVAAMAEF